MEITLLNVLYVVLIVAVVAVGGLFAAALWQVTALLAEARRQIVPDLRELLVEAQHNLKNAEDITADMNGKLSKLDGAFEAANTAVQSIGETTDLVNRALAKPLVINAAAFFAGVKSTAAYLRDHRKDRRPLRETSSRPEREVEPVGR